MNYCLVCRGTSPGGVYEREDIMAHKLHVSREEEPTGGRRLRRYIAYAESMILQGVAGRAANYSRRKAVARAIADLEHQLAGLASAAAPNFTAGRW
jgi:hypothetical protein